MVTAATWIQSVSRSDGGSAPRDDLYSPERQRRPGHRWAPETDPQWGPRHLDGHQDKTTGTSWVLCTIWLCCSMEQPAGSPGQRRTCPPTEPVFSSFCHRWSFGSLPLSTLACLVGDTSFPAISSTWLHRYCLNWTELDDDHWIQWWTAFNSKLSVYYCPFALLIHYFPIWYCKAALTICIVKSAI